MGATPAVTPSTSKETKLFYGQVTVFVSSDLPRYFPLSLNHKEAIQSNNSGSVEDGKRLKKKRGGGKGVKQHQIICKKQYYK